MQVIFSTALHLLRGKHLLRLLMLAVIGFMAPVMATSIAPPPIISISTYLEPLGGPTFSASKQSSYTFDTSIQYQGGFLLKTDLYFGILLPGKNKVLAWVNNGERVSLQDKMIPIAKSIDLKEKSVFNLSNVLGRNIQYTFTGAEPSGMYLIFTLLVVSGTDPANTQNWIGVNMSPLFFNP